MQTSKPQADHDDRNGMVAVLSSRGFLFGSAALAIAFVLQLALQSDALPQGPASDLATLYVQLTLPPTALFVFAIAGLLVPPAPFMAGLLLGVVDAALITVLVNLAPEGALEGVAATEMTADLVSLWIIAIAVGTVVTGAAGLLAKRVFRRSTERSRPFSDSYRNADTRARATQVTLAISGLLAAAMAVVLVDGVGVLDEFVAGTGNRTSQNVDALVSLSDDISSLTVAAAIATAIAFLAWLSRSVDNVSALGGGTPRWSPRWAIAWWFIPIANLLMPLLVVRDLARRMGALDASKYTSATIALWWLLYIGASGARLGSAARSPVDVEELRAQFIVGALSQVTLAVAAVLGIVVVGRLQAAADERASQQD